jgi:hypothetical protein
MAEELPIDESTVRLVFSDVAEPSISYVFRDFDATDLNCNTIEFPKPSGFERIPGPVDEGEKIPSTATEYETQTLEFDKFGFEVTTEDGVEDVRDEVEFLYASTASTVADTIYGADIPLEWRRSDTRSGMIEEALYGAYSEATPDVDAVVVPEVLGEAIADEDPTREWDELAADIGSEYGVDVLTDEYNVLRGSDVLVVDRDRFGYEAHRENFETNVWEEFEEHDPAYGHHVPEEDREVRQEVIQAWLRRGWTVVDDDSAYIARFCKLP